MSVAQVPAPVHRHAESRSPLVHAQHRELNKTSGGESVAQSWAEGNLTVSLGVIAHSRSPSVIITNLICALLNL